MVSSKSPTQRTLDRLRSDGWRAQVVERWIDHHDPSTALRTAMDILRRTSMADTGQTLGLLGRTADRMHRRGPPGVRKDLYGIGDVIAINPDVTLLVQCCSQSTYAAHVAKIITAPLPMKGCDLCDQYLDRLKLAKEQASPFPPQGRCGDHLAAVEWLRLSSRRFQLWGWRSLKPRNQKRFKWEPNIRVFHLEDIIKAAKVNGFRFQ